MIGHLLSRISVGALLDRRVAGAELHVRTVVPLAILDVQMGDAVVVRAQERHRVVVAGGVVADVEVDDERLRHAEQLLHARRRRHFVRILHLRVRMPGRLDAVLLGERRDARAHADARLVGREHRHLQRLHLPEHGVDLARRSCRRRWSGRRRTD